MKLKLFKPILRGLCILTPILLLGVLWPTQVLMGIVWLTAIVTLMMLAWALGQLTLMYQNRD